MCALCCNVCINNYRMKCTIQRYSSSISLHLSLCTYFFFHFIISLYLFLLLFSLPLFSLPPNSFMLRRYRCNRNDNFMLIYSCCTLYQYTTPPNCTQKRILMTRWINLLFSGSMLIHCQSSAYIIYNCMNTENCGVLLLSFFPSVSFYDLWKLQNPDEFDHVLFPMLFANVSLIYFFFGNVYCVLYFVVIIVGVIHLKHQQSATVILYAIFIAITGIATVWRSYWVCVWYWYWYRLIRCEGNIYFLSIDVTSSAFLS